MFVDEGSQATGPTEASTRREGLREHLDVYTVIFSFALDDERAHAPDEFFRISSFRRGQQAWSRLWQRIAETQ